MSDYLSIDPKDAIEAGGFLTGKTLTIGGYKLYTTDFNGKSKTDATCVELYFTFPDEAGKRQTQSQKYIAGYVDNVVPSKDGLGLAPPKGASRPGIRQGSEFHAFCVSLVAAGFDEKLAGPLTVLVGLEFVAGSQVIKRPRKASEVDPDAPPKKEYPFVIVASIETLPKDNKKYKGLTEEQIEKVDNERDARRAARATATAAPSDDDEEETPAPKKTKKPAPPADEDDDDEETPAEKADDDETSADDDDSASSDDDDADEPTTDPKVAAAAKSAVLAALDKGSKVKMIQFTKDVFEQIQDQPKVMRNKIIALVQDEDFLAGLKGFTVKNNVVSRA